MTSSRDASLFALALLAPALLYIIGIVAYPLLDTVNLSFTIAYATLPAGENFIALFESDPAVEEGKSFAAGIDPVQCHLFDAAGLAVGR
jgi:ABC-type sugar transport system permease subunit